MSIDEQTLLYALETSAFLVPELPGRVDRLGVPGIQGRITADSDPFANLVGAATLDEGNADETIWHVREIYAGWNKEFGWLISPLSTPFDLPSRLEGAGLVKSVEMAGMVCTDLGRPIAANPAVYVHEATADDVEAAIHTLADAMEIPVDRAYAMTEALFFSPEPIVRRVYLAYVEGVDYPGGDRRHALHARPAHRAAAVVCHFTGFPRLWHLHQPDGAAAGRCAPGWHRGGHHPGRAGDLSADLPQARFRRDHAHGAVHWAC